MKLLRILLIQRKFVLALAVLLSGLLFGTGGILGPACHAEDWPGYRGLYRDGISRETGLLQSWPEEGPKLLWQTNVIGGGYSAPSIVGNRLYTNGHIKNVEFLICLDAETGQPIWGRPVGPANHKGGGTPGARCTPSIHRGMVYTQGIAGDLVCFEAETGNQVWRRSLVRDLRGVIPPCGYCDSPLVDGKWILCMPGGKAATVAALFRVNGQPVFKSGMIPWKGVTGEPAGYGSIVKASIGGQQQYLVTTANSLCGIRVRGGDLLWRYDGIKSEKPGNTPIWYAQTVFQTGPENNALIWPKKGESGATFTVEEIYNTDTFKVPFLSAVRVNDQVFGGTDDKYFTCASLKDGKEKWTTTKCGQACSCMYADGMVYVRNIKGGVCLVAADGKEFKLCGRFVLPAGPKRGGYAAPVVAHGRMYIRDQNFLFCYDVSKAGIEPPGPVRGAKKPKTARPAGPALRGEISNDPTEEMEPAEDESSPLPTEEGPGTQMKSATPSSAGSSNPGRLPGMPGSLKTPTRRPGALPGMP